MTECHPHTLPDGFALRPYTPSDRAWVTASHAAHYQSVEQFDASFGAAVAAALAEFDARLGHDRSFGLILHGPKADRCGSIFVCDMSGQGARLRLFLLERRLQGRGLGMTVLSAALEQASETGFRQIEVSTFTAHIAACRLYTRAGFSETGRRSCLAFGREMVKVDLCLRIGSP